MFQNSCSILDQQHRLLNESDPIHSKSLKPWGAHFEDVESSNLRH